MDSGFGLCAWENGNWSARGSPQNARVLQAVDRQLVLALFNGPVGQQRPALVTSWLVTGECWGDSCLRFERGKPNDWLTKQLCKPQK
jgi:hypothetical protein